MNTMTAHQLIQKPDIFLSAHFVLVLNKER